MRSEFHFLYRQEQGRIGPNAWMGGALPLVMALAALTLVARDAIGYVNPVLSERAFYEPSAIFAQVYLLSYSLALVLIAVCWVNLGAKRFRDRGWRAPAALAGLAPFLAFCAGAAHWLQPRVSEVMDRWPVLAMDALAGAALVWTLIEMARRGAGETA